MRVVLIFLFLLVLTQTIYAQKEHVFTDSLSFDSEIQRHLTHPILMIQGKIPGLSVYDDRNPNGGVEYRLRGFSRFGEYKPLIIVDGIVNSDLDFLNPNEISSIGVRKSLAESALYGLRGPDGIIEIQTNNVGKTGNSADYFRVNYSTYFAQSNKSNEVPVMNRSQFINAGGNDLRANTNWQNEVSRTAISNNHQLTVSGKSNTLSYQLGVNIGNVEGILDNSGFDRTNLRIGAQHTSEDERLSIRVNAYNNRREESLSFIEAFRYATVYNPTAPVRFENGEYFQAIIFDNFNPVAIIEQNINEREREETGYAVDLKLNPLEGVTFRANYSKLNQDNFQGQYYSPISFFRGLNRNGLVIRSDFENAFQSLRNEIRYSVPLTKNRLEVYSGLNYWDKKEEFSINEFSDFNSDPDGYEVSQGQANSINLTTFTSSTAKNNSLYWGGMFSSNLVNVESRIRRESYNVLGEANESDWFTDFIASSDIKDMFNLNAFDAFSIKVSASKSALYQDLYRATQEISRDPNPDLRIPTISEQTAGVQGVLLENKLQFMVDVYRRSFSGFIGVQYVPANKSITGANFRFENLMDLSSTGFELGATYQSNLTENSSFSTKLSLATLNIKLDDYILEESLRGYPGAPGQGSTRMIRLAVGEELGQIWGPVFDRVAQEGETETFTFGGGQSYSYTYSKGEPIFKDINGDGIKKTSMGQALDEDADFTVLGKAYPDFEFGWTSTFNISRFFAEAHFRGAVGHSKVNLNRMFYEAIDQGAINSYNRVNSEKAAEGLTFAYYSSLYVERADFIAMDYFSLGYSVNMNRINGIKSLRLTTSLEDVFTITNYTGVSPEPVYSDYGPVDNGGFGNANSDPLTPGIDRRLNYLPARSILFGISIDF
jgi:iron complex outermembrane receptor protein